MDMYTFMILAALFTNAPKCPSTNGWTNKMWYIHAMDTELQSGVTVRFWREGQVAIQKCECILWLYFTTKND